MLTQRNIIKVRQGLTSSGASKISRYTHHSRYTEDDDYIVKLACLKERFNFLEVACSNGDFSIRLKEKIEKVKGQDLSQSWYLSDMYTDVLYFDGPVGIFKFDVTNEVFALKILGKIFFLNRRLRFRMNKTGGEKFSLIGQYAQKAKLLTLDVFNNSLNQKFDFIRIGNLFNSKFHSDLEIAFVCNQFLQNNLNVEGYLIIKNEQMEAWGHELVVMKGKEEYQAIDLKSRNIIKKLPANIDSVLELLKK